jgi:hypothetical protein
MLALGRLTHMRTFPLGLRGLTMKSEVPFGPFLIASTFLFWVCMLNGFDPLGFYLNLWI